VNAAEASSLKAVLVAIFTRKGGNGRHLRTVEALDQEARGKLQVVAGLGTDELLVLGSYEDPSAWLLLTTSRLVWRNSGLTMSVRNSSIRDVTVDFEALHRQGKTKAEARELRIECGDAHYTIEVEPGPPLSGIWNAIRHLAVRNRGPGVATP
jgi:hypothetical protein